MRVSFFVGAAVLLRKIGRLRAGDVGREAGKGIRSAEGYRAGPRQEGAKKHPGGVRLFPLYHCKPQDARGKKGFATISPCFYILTAKFMEILTFQHIDTPPAAA